MTQQYGSLREKIAAESAARRQRYQGFEQLYADAEAAGLRAAEACKPTPMVVTQHQNMLDDGSKPVKQWYVPEGPCGFAWITVRPGNSSFAIWLKKNKGAGKDYYGGVTLSASVGGQSVQIKEAYAHAFAEVLQRAGINARATSRLD